VNGLLRFLIALALVAPSVVWAQGEPPPELDLGVDADLPDRLGPWERELAADLLEARGRVPAADPDLPVCGVEIVRLDVFTPDDADDLPRWLRFAPRWANALHVTTRERTVRRNLTFGVGDTWSDRVARDGERALRDPYVFSTVFTVAMQSDDPGCVDVLVVTRDVWSLRPSFFLETAGVLTLLHVGVYEANFAGSGDTVGVGFDFERGHWALGPYFVSRRFRGSPFDVYVGADGIRDRELERPEGGRFVTTLDVPIRDTSQRWGGGLGFEWSDERIRRYVGPDVATWDAAFTPVDDAVDERWRQRRRVATGRVTRAWGQNVRHLLSPGFRASDVSAEARPLADVDPVVLAAFSDERLPRSETAVGPTLRWETFVNRHMTIANYAGFRTGEEIRLGPEASISARWAETALGSTTRFVDLSATWWWTLRVGRDGFVRFAAGQSARALADDRRWVDLVTSGTLRFVTPSTRGGRLVVRGTALDSRFDEARSFVSLGADTAVRGYTAGSFFGRNRAIANAEWRTPPLELLTAWWGLVAFYDGGAVWDDGEPITWVNTLGVGGRVVVPWVDTRVRLLDVGFPLDGPTPGRPVFSIGFDQPF